MFKEMLVIDLFEHIDDLTVKISSYAQKIIYCNNSLEIAEDVSGVECLLTSIYQDITKDLLKKMPKLRNIFVLGTSLKRIDGDFCKQQNIALNNVHGYCDQETAEWVMYRIFKHFREQETPHSINGKILGIVGVGAVGSELAKRALALNMSVLYYSQKPNKHLDELGIRYVSQTELFAWSDIISWHTPAHTQCYTYKDIKTAKKNALIINSCMGLVIDKEDLVKALSERSDISVVMDEVAYKSYASLKNMPNLIFDPQAAYLTPGSVNRLEESFFKQLKLAIRL